MMTKSFQARSRAADAGGRLGRIALSLVLALSLVPTFSSGAADEAWADDDAALVALTTSDLSTLAEGDVFQAESEGVSIYFTVTGDDTVAVGRGNSSGGSDLAVDADYAGAVVLPDEVSDGSTTYAVTEIQSYAFGSGLTSDGWSGAQATSVSIPGSIQTIDDYAFYGAPALVGVDFAEDGVLQTIGANAFGHCHALESVEIPASVVEIGRYAFGNDTSLASATFAEGTQIETISDHAFAGSANYPGALESFEYPAVDTVSDYVLYYQTSLTELTFAGETYAQIGESAFAYCSSLPSVTIPDLTGGTGYEHYQLMDNCFAYDTGLQTVIFAGDTDDYEFFYIDSSRGYGPFCGDSAVINVVYMGAKCSYATLKSEIDESSSDTMQGDTYLFGDANDEDVNIFYNVTFYDSEADAEEGVDSVGSVRVRSDASYGEIRSNELSDEQIFDDGGFVPEASGAWSFEGGPLDVELIEDSCWAYDSDSGSLESCTVTMGRTDYVCKGSPVELDYTVTTATGKTLEEGSDYTTSIYLDGEEVSAEDLDVAGDYTLVFEGIGDYEGEVETSFSISMASVDWAILAGQDSIDLSKTVSRGCTESGSGGQLVFIVGEGSEDYALACLGAAGLNDSVILVTAQDELSDETRTQLNRTDANAVVLVGTSDDVSDEVNSELNSFNNVGLSVSRVAAEDLADAAATIYERFADEGLGADGVAYVVASDNPTLAAAVGSEAYENARPIFFCGSDGQLDGSTRSALKTGGFESVVVLSDSADAVAAVEEQVDNESIAFESIVGSAAEASAQVAGEQVAGLDLEEGSLELVVGSAVEEGAGDAALAAMYAARNGACLLLAETEEEASDAMAEAIGDAWQDIDSVRFVGRRSVVPQDAVDGVLASWYGGYTQFDDVSATAWYADYVNEAVDAGLVTGYADDDGEATGEFGANDELTRATVATILYRAAGADAGDGQYQEDEGYATETLYDDEASGVWYTAAINWCSNAGILYGDGNGKVRPNDSITREELACMLMRYAAYEGYDIDEDALPAISDAQDADEVSSWAVTAMRWTNAEDILVGFASDDGNYLQPDGTATRSQMAKLGVIVRAMTLEL